MSTHDIGAIIEALEQYTRGDDHQRAIDAAVEVLRAVESRESALIAERDALRGMIDTYVSELVDARQQLARYKEREAVQGWAPL